MKNGMKQQLSLVNMYELLFYYNTSVDRPVIISLTLELSLPIREARKYLLVYQLINLSTFHINLQNG